jgi:hypothetical protein
VGSGEWGVVTKFLPPLPTPHSPLALLLALLDDLEIDQPALDLF